jgi:ATP-dependent helicase/nuclease subunit A
MEFSEEQLATLVNDRHQIVIANAGSGKTTILVEKFFNLILDFDIEKINRVVAITFTKKAASEMKERLIKRLGEEIDKLKENKVENIDFLMEYKKLMNYREHISSAKIQTIHSFCKDIFSEYSTDLGFNPNFNIIDEPELKTLVDNYFNEILEELLTNPQSYSFNIAEAFDFISNDLLSKLVYFIIENPNVYEYLLNSLNSFADSYHAFETDYYQKVVKYAEKLHNESLSYFTEPIIERLSSEDKSQVFIENINKLKEIDFKGIEHPKDFLNYLFNLWSDTVKIKFGRKTCKSYLDKEDKKNFENNLSSIGVCSKTEYLKVYYSLIQNIFSFSKIINDKIEDYKKENSLISYNDMLWKTYKILQNDEILTKVQAEFDYILIDEFQDTDNIQYSIMKKIIPSLQNAVYNSKIFVVGDPKQSIYGFRNADVRVIKTTYDEIQSINDNLIKQGKLSANSSLKMYQQNEEAFVLKGKTQFGLNELKISHRLNLVNTAFVNYLFANLMNNNDFEYSVNYNELIFARKNPYLEDFKEVIDITNEKNVIEKYGSVEFLFTLIETTKQKSNSDNSDEVEANNGINEEDDEIDSPTEAQSVVNYIKKLINAGTKIFDSKINNFKTLKFKDILILARQRNGLSNLLQEFNKNKIPYVLNDSDNYFDTQEVIDIITFFKFLLNPNNDLTFAALLKSNFFGLSDFDIFKIRNFNKDKSLWGSFENLFINNDENIKLQINDYSLLQDVYNLIIEIKTKFLNLNLSDFLSEFFLTTNYLSTFQNNIIKDIIYSNVNNFIKFIQKAISAGKITLSDLLQEIDKYKDSRAGDSENQISNENGVNILTIHKAKGLEYPVVILYNANHRVPNTDNIVFDETNGLCFKFSIFNEQGLKEDIKLPLLDSAVKFKMQKEFEESKRLLYVALTRAKDLLVISSTLKLTQAEDAEDIGTANKIIRESPKGLMKLIMEGLKLNIDDLNDIVINNTYKLSKSLKIYSNKEYKEKQITFNIPIITEIENQEICEEVEQNSLRQQEAKDSNSDILFMLNELNQKEPIVHHSATKFQKLISDEKQYVERYLMKFPELMYENNATMYTDQISGKDRGLIIHSSIENIESWINEDKTININRLEAIINNKIYDLNINISNEQKSLIINELISVVDSPFIKERLEDLLKANFEFVLQMPLGGDILKVIYDVLLFNSTTKEYEIWDWKNNVITDDVRKQKLVKYYELQMKIYCYVLSYLYPDQKNYQAKIFFTRLAKDLSEKNDWIHTYLWAKSELEQFYNELVELSDKTKNLKILLNYINDI